MDIVGVAVELAFDDSRGLKCVRGAVERTIWTSVVTVP